MTPEETSVLGGKIYRTKKSAKHASSSWDPNWMTSFGGFDDPKERVAIPGGGSIPKAFVPDRNPFYVALPYNDLTKGGLKPEASKVIPWFHSEHASRGSGSVCRDRWIAIRKKLPNGTQRICYAQWSDCGPVHTDSWKYVFGDERPKLNSAFGAGLSVSPAIRDYLGIEATDVVDWCFADLQAVPSGPWGEFGKNNTLKQRHGKRP